MKKCFSVCILISQLLFSSMSCDTVTKFQEHDIFLRHRRTWRTLVNNYPVKSSVLELQTECVGEDSLSSTLDKVKPITLKKNIWSLPKPWDSTLYFLLSGRGAFSKSSKPSGLLHRACVLLKLQGSIAFLCRFPPRCLLVLDAVASFWTSDHV